jgi:hypothetical protein
MKEAILSLGRPADYNDVNTVMSLLGDSGGQLTDVDLVPVCS